MAARPLRRTPGVTPRAAGVACCPPGERPVDFDASRPPSVPRDAATVILLRARASDGAAEVFLLRRHRQASFMAQAFVFPGGARDGAEDLRVTAARELFEEAGVLLADRELAP